MWEERRTPVLWMKLTKLSPRLVSSSTMCCSTAVVALAEKERERNQSHHLLVTKMQPQRYICTPHVGAVHGGGGL